METGLLHLHNVLRWLVLLTALWAVLRTLPLMFSNRPVLNSDRKAGLFYLIACDLQLLIGLYLYFSRNWDAQLINDGKAVMANKVLRFWAVEHMAGMLIAIFLVHIGYRAVKHGKGKSAGLLFLISLLLILATIPWPFREGIGRGLFPGA